MDAQQALADLTEISSQIQSAVIFDAGGKVAAATAHDDERARALADGAAQLLERAASARAGDTAPTQLEVATNEGSVFVVREGDTRIAAVTGPQPTVGLVFYDLKSALRQIAATPKPPARTRKPRAPKKAESSSAPPAKAAEKKPAAVETTDAAAEKKPPAPKKKATPRKKPDAT